MESYGAAVLPIDANSERLFNEVNAVMSRLPIGIVILRRGLPAALRARLRARRCFMRGSGIRQP